MSKIAQGLVVAGLVAAIGCARDGSSLKVVQPGPQQTQAIQGGTIDQNDPAVVAIVIESYEGMGICTGSLIAPNLVLTAHHCVASINDTMCSSNSFGSNYATSSFAVTSSYNAASSMYNQGRFPSIDNRSWYGVSRVAAVSNNVCGGDVAVLELSSAVSGVCPIMPRVDSPVADGESYRAVGFGVTSPSGQAAGQRYSASGLSVLCASNCGSEMSASLEWEGGTNANVGACSGDSGGPALDTAGRVIGTVSRGPAYSCNETIYESVYGHRTWIKQQAQTAASNGGYTAAGWVTGGSTGDLANDYCDGTTGSNGGSTGGDTGGSTGSTGGACADAALTCIDASGQGDYACIDEQSSTGFPADAPDCQSDADCPTGYACWVASSNATVGQCLQSCTPGGSSGGDTGGSTGGSAGGSCSDSALTCYDATGQGDYVCLDEQSSTGFPADAPECQSDADCPANFGCWVASANATVGQCLENCTPGGSTGGGTGGTGGDTGGDSGGDTGGDTGGGTGGDTGGTGGGGSDVGASSADDDSAANESNYEAETVSCSGAGATPALAWLLLVGLWPVARRRAR